MTDCIFCKIAQGSIPSNKVYEDRDVLAFLDINPLTDGHTLVIPKRHAVRLDEMAPQDAGRLFERAAVVLKAVTAAVGRADSLVAVHNGPQSGQEVPHVHVHVVPRAASDAAGPVHALFRNRPKAEPATLRELAARIRAKTGRQEAAAGEGS